MLRPMGGRSSSFAVGSPISAVTSAALTARTFIDNTASPWCSLFYSTLERILAEWPEHCGRPDGLRWVRDRLADVEKAV